MKITIESVSGSVHCIENVTTVHMDIHFLGIKDPNEGKFKGKGITYTVEGKEGVVRLPVEEIAWIEVDQ